MKLVVLYGPPGVGKLTIAKELAKITGYNNFHNHLTFEPVRSILPIEHPDFWSIVKRWRLQLLEIAAKNKVKGLIITVVYTKKESMIPRVIRLMKKYHAQTYFVKLHCDHHILKKRVKHPSRKAYRKLRTIKGLNAFCKKHDVHSSVPNVKNFEIDNTHVSPKQCAKMIAKHYKLR